MTTTATSTLSQRYVSAVARSVPQASRDDISAELEASIADQVDGRIAAGDAPEAAERSVISELGDPIALAATLSDRPLWLIGPKHYTTWLRLLRLLLWTVAPLAAIGIGVASALTGGDVGDVIASIFAGLLQIVVHIAFWVTLVFVILERTGNDSGLPEWNPDQLPAATSRAIGLSDLIATIVMCVVMAGTLVWDRFVGWGDDAVHVLAEDLWPGVALGFLVILLATVLVALVVFIRGRWSFGLALVNVLLGLITAVGACVLIWQNRLLHSDLTGLWADSPAGVTMAIDVTLTAVFIGVLLSSIADSWGKVVKARRA
ncbi:permease prefix domain 1-containing protein [Microbacterium sp. SD291]|uniref:permease prefix domain 1-containing protein n=1 Tax=Microbacterium sp. SD291 TaxID=2782007 RepID=UPI001A974C44|nr:permease prefix domain 1-containing protein [Microbacterium sp. SD291]MBO0981988.1 hypothetical protein [Microbacterium sp. SD291]